MYFYLTKINKDYKILLRVQILEIVGTADNPIQSE